MFNDPNFLFNEEVGKEQKQMTISGNCQRAKVTIYYCLVTCLHIMYQFMFGFSVRGNTLKRPKPHQNHPKPHSKHTKHMNLVRHCLERAWQSELKVIFSSIEPYPTLPYPTLPYPTLSYPTLPYPTLPYPTLPLPYHTLPIPYPTHTLPYPTLPYPTLPYPIPYPTLPYTLNFGLRYPTLENVQK